MRPAHGMLRCPRCRSEFRGSAGALVCVAGHSFDLARSGYVNLLAGRRRLPAPAPPGSGTLPPGRGRLPAAGGAARVRLRRRRASLGAGPFVFIAVAVGWARPLGGPSPRVLAGGWGTGHYLDRVTAGLAIQV